jgi:DNA invertase Pin-like site-specific DNA recombinase
MKQTELKFFAYCRKSSIEDSGRQVASIGDQKDALAKMIEAEKLNIVREPFSEEMSAKNPGRPIFNEMLDQIEQGKANAIACWAVNRLYRNPVDEGRLRWMLQKGIIKVIKTPSREFYPDDAGLLMGVEGCQATDYVIRLSKDVKRGLNGRVAKGWRPSLAPIGYLF